MELTHSGASLVVSSLSRHSTVELTVGGSRPGPASRASTLPRVFLCPAACRLLRFQGLFLKGVRCLFLKSAWPGPWTRTRAPDCQLNSVCLDNAAACQMEPWPTAGTPPLPPAAWCGIRVHVLDLGPGREPPTVDSTALCLASDLLCSDACRWLRFQGACVFCWLLRFQGACLFCRLLGFAAMTATRCGFRVRVFF